MIGILGGTFDPIHYGHLRTALDVQQALGLDEIRLIPLRDPPHRAQPQTSPEQRLAVIAAAIKDDSRFKLDSRELERPGKSYTVDTLYSLRQELGNVTLCLLLGSDAFHDFDTWHQPEQILQLAHLVVMQRPGEAPPRHYLKRITSNPAALRQQATGCILLQPVTQLAISASKIRQMLAQGDSPDFLLPESSLEMIRRLNLYGV